MDDKTEELTVQQEAENDSAPLNQIDSDGETSAPFNFDQLKQLIDDHFNKIKALVRYTKEKDENIVKLSKQMQIYRDGIETSLLKRVALEVIAYREGCRKSLRSLSTANISVQEAQKYIGYLKLDFEDMLENLGIKCTDEAVLYNGKNIDAPPENIEFKDVPKLDDVEMDNPDIADINGLIDYLKNCHDALSKMIKNNVILDSVIKDYISASSVYEQGLYQVVLYPVIRAVVALYRSLSNRVESLEINDSNATEIYSTQLSLLIEEAEKILELCNVQIDGYVSDVYNSQKHRILKMIDTDNPELNGQVVCRYSDCYTMEGKVICLSKVDVYKNKKIN